MQNSSQNTIVKKTDSNALKDTLKNCDKENMKVSEFAKSKNNRTENEKNGKLHKTSDPKESHEKPSFECAQEKVGGNPMRQQDYKKKNLIEQNFQKCSLNEMALNKKLREALKQNEQLKSQVESLRIQKDEERELGRQMQLLNMELQKQIIDFFNEIKCNDSSIYMLILFCIEFYCIVLYWVF